MKDVMRSVLLVVAIYSGIIAANSHDYSINIPMSILCGVACGTFVVIKNDKKN